MNSPTTEKYMDSPTTPFTNAKFIGADCDSRQYVKENAKRGDAGYRVSRSMLMEFAHNPHRWRAGYTRPETNALAIGSLMDVLTLTPNSFAKLYDVRPDTYPDGATDEDGHPKRWNSNAKICKKWLEEHPTWCKAATYHDALVAADILRQDALVTDLLDCSAKQVEIHAEYRAKVTGLVVPVKCLIDLVPDGQHRHFGRSLADYKTCRTVSTFKWPMTVDSYHYDAQAALELDMWTALHPDDARTEFFHVCQENYPPFEVGRKVLSNEFIELGRLKYLRALELYCDCLIDNYWPGMDDRGKTLSGWSLINATAWMMERAKQSIGELQEPPTEQEPSTQNDLIP